MSAPATASAQSLSVSSGTLTKVPSTSPLGCLEVEVAALGEEPVTVSWHVSLGGAVGYWTSRVGGPKDLSSDPSTPTIASLTAEAPVGVLFDAQSRCTHAIAVSETVREVSLRLGVSEEDNRIDVAVALPVGAAPARIRLYPAGPAYEDVLADAAKWWTSRDPMTAVSALPATLPAEATDPVCSTWYSMHQQLEQHALDRELTLAAELGMRTVIIDDGWQTVDNQRGYAYTGDWVVAPSRFPDLAAHVDRTHSLALAELLWVALPFVGRHSVVARDLEHLLLPGDGRLARLWDVRLPAARDHVAQFCRRLVAAHNLDGLKIDFVDEWSSYPTTPKPDGADTDDYAEAVDRLLGTIVAELCAVVDNPLVEFRQPYAGPRMLRYGNLFRVADCPANGHANRVRSVDLRHLVKDRAVHADMVMWSATDPAEDAADQLLCTAFAVPQISMLLADLPIDHVVMLRHYLNWWVANREVLLKGQLRAPRPDLGYPVVTAVHDRQSVAISYADHSVISVSAGRAVIANATGTDSVVVEMSSPGRMSQATDCRGNSLTASDQDLPPGLHRLRLPRGGSCVVES